MTNNNCKYGLTIHNNQGASWYYRVGSLAEARRLMINEFTDPRNLSAVVVDNSAEGMIVALKRTNSSRFARE